MLISFLVPCIFTCRTHSLNLAQFGLDKLAAQAHKELTYKGLFVASETGHLAGGNYDLQKTVTYDKEDLETLLEYNIKLFTGAAEVIRSGNFAVNPYTEDGKSVSRGSNQGYYSF